MAVESNVIKKGGSWYTYGTDKVQGELAAEQWLPQIDGLIDDLDNWLSDTGYSTMSQEVKEAEALVQEVEQFEPPPRPEPPPGRIIKEGGKKVSMKKKTVKRSLKK